MHPSLRHRQLLVVLWLAISLCALAALSLVADPPPAHGAAQLARE